MPTIQFLKGFNDAKVPLRQLIEFVHQGLSFDVLEGVARAYGLSQQDMARLIDVAPRTLQRRRLTGRFDALESERLYRFIRLFRRALEVFDDDSGSARQFLTEPQPGLNGEVPVEMARSELGASEVMDLLGRIDYGVYT